MGGDKSTRKEIQLVLDDKTIGRIRDTLTEMKEEFTKRTPRRPAEELIRQHIALIDELTKLGASLTQIFERLNKVVPIGISSNSFSVYVRRVRRETGSDQYNRRKTKKQNMKDTDSSMPVTQSETISTHEMQFEATKTEKIWNCERCKESSERHRSVKKPGTFYWKCLVCGTNYEDNDGELTDAVIKITAN